MHDPVHPLANKEIVLGVAGGIAAYKAAELSRLLVKAEARVRVVMTEHAQQFIGALTFQALTGQQVFTDLFSLTQESDIGHIQIADSADLIIIAPATANTIARMAAGLADDALTAVLLATRAPILLAPSMNVNMWRHPITQANVKKLVEQVGVKTVGPGDGFLACRWTGPGRLAEPSDIVEAAARVLTDRDLTGRIIAISAGPTHEPLDPVRFLGNRSSGKMGYALAAAAARRGAAVRLVSGPVSLDPPPGVDRIDVVDARSMQRRIAAAADDADAVIMAAAVADYRPREQAAHKLKKVPLGENLAPSSPERSNVTLVLETNPDILGELGAKRRAGGQKRPILIGFAAETRDVIEYARAKLARKYCDLVIANDVSQSDAGFSVDTNRVAVVSSSGVENLDLASKEAVAHRIIDRLVELFED
ncbi:MAG: bifunctional phosphopantothenoylcysteine decarboxylase/phosphopantothenate--cysteine ligase CoaBC [Proteobacteria bacterium]|nr:bifunctional phosphopantothenoylcysteine decarboxylase/phosphopantothenate--cysteine ligase CoaBC [Pseudomonadota bacterium]